MCGQREQRHGMREVVGRPRLPGGEALGRHAPLESMRAKGAKPHREKAKNSCKRTHHHPTPPAAMVSGSWGPGPDEATEGDAMTHKAVILAAGYGSRFLPVTRVVPKELLPIIARPALDLVIEELCDAGITDILVITSRRKRAVEDWFDHDLELEAAVANHPARHRLALPRDLKVTFERQRRMRGTGHALLQARSFAGTDPVVVAFPDDLFGGANVSRAHIDVHQQTGCSVLATQALPPHEDVSRYGVLDMTADGQVRGIVEKPAPGTEPSRHISLGRYLYTPAFFDRLAHHWAGHSGEGEYYPMAALSDLVGQGRLRAAETTAHRWDTGHPLGYLQCVLDHALDDPTLAEPLRTWITKRLGLSR